MTSTEKWLSVALYVREIYLQAVPGTDWREVQRSGIPPQRVAVNEAHIRKGIRVLEAMGFRDVRLTDHEWDEDPQSGRAYYIYASCRPPAGRDSDFDAGSLRAIGTHCLEYRPNACIQCNIGAHQDCAAIHDADVGGTPCVCHCHKRPAVE